MTQKEYDIQQAKRQPVDAGWLWSHPDLTGYIYNDTAAEMGLDPWQVIEGMDMEIKTQSIILETGRTGRKKVDPTYTVYISNTIDMEK